ncbi:Cupin 2 barrel domain-containing protein [Gottschalkia acidurici 9a]|uniref:Cupin 2 barrel domain-containing protein n=1 Tax=Gottschalkia acidurici (strain ATCC 7906 / DSM 604 / BCRC 14475 / CIP 104303 / KCTC 5404 / NCIMB 10678 / 9a) TaxID=1128398 RepID=K0AXI5_GOTA9|nr:cupin domain-containing protein [Gottschalkia acidurici]AFS77440.1 Cupin 2 barrel domain-containing protein [Gottschalkia acidurici 9a]
MKVIKNISPINPMKINDIISNSSGSIASKAICNTESTDIRFFSYAKDESISKEFQEEDSIIYIIEGELKVLYDEENEKKEVTLKEGELIALPSNLNYGIYATKDSKSFNILVK